MSGEVIQLDIKSHREKTTRLILKQLDMITTWLDRIFF